MLDKFSSQDTKVYYQSLPFYLAPRQHLLVPRCQSPPTFLLRIPVIRLAWNRLAANARICVLGSEADVVFDASDIVRVDNLLPLTVGTMIDNDCWPSAFAVTVSNVVR